MSIIYATNTLNARLNAVVSQIDAGSGPGTLKIGTSGMAQVLSTIPMAIPCGTVSGGVLTLTTPIADPLVAVTGTLASAEIEDSNGNLIASGLTVGLSSAFDIIMSSLSVTAGQNLSIISATIRGQ